MPLGGEEKHKTEREREEEEEGYRVSAAGKNEGRIETVKGREEEMKSRRWGDEKGVMMKERSKGEKRNDAEKD